MAVVEGSSWKKNFHPLTLKQPSIAQRGLLRSAPTNEKANWSRIWAHTCATEILPVHLPPDPQVEAVARRHRCYSLAWFQNGCWLCGCHVAIYAHRIVSHCCKYDWAVAVPSYACLLRSLATAWPVCTCNGMQW